MARFMLLMLLCSTVHRTAGYSAGAGDDACITMTPGHGSNTATGDAPYSFTITQTNGSAVTEYSAGQTLWGIRSIILNLCPFRIPK